jgi:hypothetical protein
MLAGCVSSGPQAQADLYVLMGQSNMSGRGLLSDLQEAALASDPQIRVYGNDGIWREAFEPLDSAEGQVDEVSLDRAAGVGPGLAFARTLRALRPARPVGLVPCAKGGTAIAEWMPSHDRSTLYGSCLARVREAQNQGRLAGILWYQGESDADSDVDATTWAARFETMITTFRADVGDPELALVVVGLGDRPLWGPYAHRFAAWETVQTAQAALRLANQAFVPAAGLPRNEDQLHLSTAGQIALGDSLAKAISSLE